MQQSGSRSAKSDVIAEPIGISAQELLRLGQHSKYGFLRKQGGLERRFTDCTCFKWRQRFVVLSQGCVYIYKGDYSDRPFRSYSCRHFKRCERHHDVHMENCFKAVPIDATGKPLVFSCLSDDHRKEWMLQFKMQLVKVHKAEPIRLDSVDTSDYVYLEENVKTSTAARVPVRPQISLPVPATDSEDYSLIDESAIVLEVPRTTNQKAKGGVVKQFHPPPLKTQSSTDTPRTGQNIQKSKIKTPPTSPSNGNIPAPSRNLFDYPGTDRDEVESLLVTKPEGTFLVRRSRSDNQEVLSVNIGDTLKEFKIYKKDNQVTINHTNYFTSVLELVQYYTNNNLPKKTVTLSMGYKDSGYINRL